jgi:hypothetical protein
MAYDGTTITGDTYQPAKLVRPMSLADDPTPFTRGSVGTYWDETGVLRTAAVNVPRYGYDRDDLTKPPMLLVEGSSQNILLNSAAPSSQALTVLAQVYTLSFYGTGTITLTGAATGSVVGTGVTKLSQLTFLTTAGSLALAISGVVTHAQLEPGSHATSRIVTTGSAVTRYADVVPDFMSNIVEAPPAVYNGGTNYAYGDFCSVMTGSLATVYRSLADNNLNHTPTSSPTFWRVVDTAYSLYDTVTSFGLNQIVTDLATHHLFQSLVGPNLSQPLTDKTKWLDLGADDRWRPFDRVIGQQAARKEFISYTFVSFGRVDSLVFFNASAVSIRVQVIDQAEGVVRDTTYSMVNNDAIVDMWTYLTEPSRRRRTLAIDDLPLGYSGAIINITILGSPAEDALVGEIVCGQSKVIGDPQPGARVGLQDFSKKEQDDWGNYDVTERAFSKTNTYTLWVNNNEVDDLIETLEDYRATPVVWLGSNQFSSTTLYGYYKDFDVELAYFVYSVMSLELEGLT